MELAVKSRVVEMSEKERKNHQKEIAGVLLRIEKKTGKCDENKEVYST